MKLLFAVIWLLVTGVAAGATNPATSVAPEAVVVESLIKASDRREYANRLERLFRDVDTTNFESLYNAQQDGMALAHAVFVFGTREEQQHVLISIDKLIGSLPTAGALANRSLVARNIASIELLAPFFTRVRQRLFDVAFAIDGVPLPRRGSAKDRRVFPTASGRNINVLSEVELQFCYLLSTVLRVAAENPIPSGHVLARRRQEMLDRLTAFLIGDKLRFYWMEFPAWHWSGPYPNMRERITAKLSPIDKRLRTPPWFGAMLDHEFHLFAVAADVQAALLAGLPYVASKRDIAMLVDINRLLLRVMNEHVSLSEGSKVSFVVDYGLWSSNPSVAYAGCADRTPVPVTPCPLEYTATDSSHARRWPWWLVSFLHSWPPASAERDFFMKARAGLARQLAHKVLYFDLLGRPLLRNYMDGVDGWYRLREAASRPWGHGPSSMTGSMRYGSWTTLALIDPKINKASVKWCEVITSEGDSDKQFRTLYYGVASSRPEMAGLGENDLYGVNSLYSLVCRISGQLGMLRMISD